MTNETAPLLLVDDRPENLLSLEAVLEPLGQPIVRASSGPDALRRLLEADFAVILLDVNMPGMDGYETAKLIKQRPRSRHVPIMFLTAGERASAIELYKLGAVDFLQKPFAPEVLVAKVSVFIELFLRGERLRVQEVELLRQAAKQSDLERSQLGEILLGVVSHDLRTPLSAMLASLQLMRRKVTDEANAKLLDRSLASGKRMGRMIDQLLDLTRVRLGSGMTLEKTSIDLSKLVGATLEEMGAANPTRTLRADLAPAVVGSWDGDRLEQVVQNLVSNALTHGDETAPVTIAVSKSESTARIVVHNQGAPIPIELRTSLFDPFRRGGGERVARGLGLGLYITQQIVGAHRGRVIVESDEEGTAFTVELPV